MGSGSGHAAGAVVNASIKSGTNQIHGDLWEYFRNNVLDARDFDALTVPRYNQNQFGATLGLPILRNKLFFFADGEANRIVFGETYVELNVHQIKVWDGKEDVVHIVVTANGTEILMDKPLREILGVNFFTICSWADDVERTDWYSDGSRMSVSSARR